MQQDRWITGLRIKVEATDQLRREMTHIVMHQVKYADDRSKCSGAFDRLEQGDRTQSAPLGNEMAIFCYACSI